MNEDRIGFGVITRKVDSIQPYISFILNAEKHKYKVTYLIIIYKTSIDADIIRKLNKHCKVICIKKGHAQTLYNKLILVGMRKSEIDRILGTPYLEKYNKVSYGTSRNYALVAALLLKLDFLFFFDTDVFPKILLSYENGIESFRGIDYIGTHLKYLNTNNDIVVTTSDYTGFYIIPRMNFPYLHELLVGIQKEDRYYYITSVDCPVTSEYCQKNICNTHKVLGGNIAIDLRKRDILPPFYSGMLVLDNECYLGRGEDTLFAPIIESQKGRCVDIDMLIFHNCFNDFPLKPDINNSKNVDRFFYACMGWVIRNPFFNWIKNEYYGQLMSITYNKRLEALKRGSDSAAEFFNDERFLLLPEAFTKTLNNLPAEISKYKKLMITWNVMKDKLRRYDGYNYGYSHLLDGT